MILTIYERLLHDSGENRKRCTLLQRKNNHMFFPVFLFMWVGAFCLERRNMMSGKLLKASILCALLTGSNMISGGGKCWVCLRTYSRCCHCNKNGRVSWKSSCFRQCGHSERNCCSQLFFYGSGIRPASGCIFEPCRRWWYFYARLWLLRYSSHGRWAAR